MPSSKSNPPKDRRVERGHEYERLAARFYVDKGFDVLERNWRAGRKEIDLIVRKRNLVVFVEVKSSASKRFGHPAERVDRRKRENLANCARQYIIAKDLSGVDLRFDVVTFVDGRIEHFPDAFEVD
jgi:putative endonuclease